MTLILATLTPRGAILATDRRTLGHNHETGKQLILTDKANKLLIGPHIALAVVGDNDSAVVTGHDHIEAWLSNTYNPDKPFRQQLDALYESAFKAVPASGFVAVSYQKGIAEAYRTNANEPPTYDSVDKGSTAKIKFAGSGNQVASDLIELHKPPLAAFDLQEALDYSVFIIQATHQLLRFKKADLPSVGLHTMAAIIDYRGTHLARGGDYTVEDHFPAA